MDHVYHFGKGYKLYNKDKGRSNFPSELNGNSNVFDQKINKNLNNILNEIFESNPKNEILSYEQNHDSNLKSNMTSTTEKNRSDDTDKFKNILSSFKSISVSGNNKEVEMIIQLSEKKTNSLQRIIELLQEAYRLTS